MKVERGALFAVRFDDEVNVGFEGGAVVELTTEQAFWLMHAGLPTLLAGRPAIPLDPPVKVRDASNDEGQIAGQLAID